MKATLGKGIDELTFGFDIANTEQMWGSADKSYTDESGDKLLAYFSRKTALRFEKEHAFRLTWIECFNPAIELLDKRPFEMPVDSLTYLIEQRSAEEPEAFEMGWLETIYYTEEWLEFQLQFGELSALNFGVHYDEQDRPLWPKSETN